MSTITKGSSVFTLINVFTVTPERQQELIDLLIQATEEVICKLPGFISANIHKSFDGVRVINYAQWKDKAAFEAFLRNSKATEHFKIAEQIAEKIDYHTYSVADVITSSVHVSQGK
ncbi:quinol monooxygenase YgiN [Thermosporothrix hazakensis]|jgi:heme-degrading monooxygenase HmoA|uniref:Quinol monooxygenase YgiN n=1 Tax=Thermosporothrix hazakensis TaxID=644383 RepID=A0A326UNJ7_THEHA|nr:antibiotic biosynthesis monooxygenase family protein [Thermosporothrix hazakensis]PZW31892.1 quinol monooxygenase YgiN [Thermosporothrix hazakensis]GCE49783.1 antibiotic biosynthesis monooxygenase [Thermosporothrix hazakensis]